MGGYFYYMVAGGRRSLGEAGRPGWRERGGGGQVSPLPPPAVGRSPSLVTAPVPPNDVAPNADGKRVVTKYSTSDRNNLMGAKSGPAIAELLLDGPSRY